MTAGRTRERLVALFIVGILLFNYPVLQLFSDAKLVFGIPILYLYLFGCWIAVIVVKAFVIEDKGPVEKPGSGGSGAGRG